jgi:hypothetical protein
VQSDPIGLLRGRNHIYVYVQNNVNNFTDRMGLVSWSGNITCFAGIAGVGAGFFYFELSSECKCNRKTKIMGFISTLAAGIGMKYTGSKSPASFVDFNSCPDPSVANGLAIITAAGVAAGGEGAGGLGFSASQMQIGGLWSPRGVGPATGLDASAAAYVGASYVTSVDVQKCCDNK